MVYIKKMICIGFKSFRKRTVIKFDRGFSAIVGSNGSGKSNIIDAFVFVLGGLSAKTLRANTIKDLISNGGNGLGAAKTASVEIIFDNKDKAFIIDLPEIKIKRKINENGQGVYILNGKRTTRKNIINILDLSGIAPNSSNMIMQGELFRLINMNGLERRELVEDIAGIASYNEKKLSAEEELVEVQTNLGQIALLLNEVYEQMAQLKQEKEDAEKYLECVSQEKLRSNALFEVRKRTAKEKISEMDQEKIKIELKISEIHKLEKSLEEKIKNFQKEIDELNPKIKEMQDSELLKMTYRMKELKDKITELKTSVKYADKNLKTFIIEQKELQEKIKSFNKQESVIKTEIEGIRNNKTEILDKIDKKKDGISELEQKLQDIDSEYIDIKKKAKEKSIEINEEKDAKNKKITDLKVIENKINGFDENKEKLENEIFLNHEKIGNLKIEIEKLNQKKRSKLGLENLDNVSKKGIENEIKNLETKVLNNQKKLTKIKPLAVKTQKEIFELKSKIKVVNHFNSGNRAVKEILKLRNNKKISGIFGTIAELGSTNNKFSIAMEMAVGGMFNFIVVESQITAEKCIKYLKSNHLGRATFIPLDEIKYRPFTNTLPSNPKIYGRAVDLINFDQKFIHAFEFVFGRTIIVDDLFTARNLHVPAKRVTIEGDIVSGSNLMAGGYKKKSKGRGFKNSNNDKQKLEKLELVYQNYQQRQNSLEIAIKNNQQEISRLYKLKISGDNKTKEISENIAVCHSKVKELKKSIDVNEHEIEEILNNILTLNNEKQSLVEEILDFNEKLTELKEQNGILQSKLDSSEASELKKELRRRENELKKLNKEANKIEIDLTKKNTTLMETISNGRKDALNQFNSKTIKISETTSSISQLSSNLNENEKEEAVLNEKINEKSKKVAQLINQRKNLNFEISEIKIELGKLANSIHPLTMKLNTFEIKSEELIMKIKEWNCQIQPDVEIPEEFLQFSVQQHQKALENIINQKNNLGPVNLRAIDKYTKISKRFEELEKKNEQVINEREVILEFIETLEKEKLKVFMKTFNAINNNFAYIFSRLSPGGEARLELDNQEDPFEEGSGVEIFARPGEKEKCNVMALSGGERTLTIIALILGIQMHVPSPYYILDEIDAALDDTNAALVADIVKELSEKSQFIIITHRDVTMARVDHLLGVSNIEGVTSVINLSIRNVLNQLEKEKSSAEA